MTKQSKKKKSAAKRAAQVAQAKERVASAPSDTKANPIVKDETYGALQEANRVVMRHQIALNIDNFTASTEGFAPRPEQQYDELIEVPVPFFSVIVPNFNGRTILGPLFEGLLHQTFRDFEVILADDASTDDSVDFVEEQYGPNSSESALDLRVLVNRANVGFAKNVNAAADAACGRVLVLLNSDTVPDVQWLAELAKAVCANPQAAIVTSKILLNDGSGRIHTTGDMLAPNGIPQNRGVWEPDNGQYDNQTAIFGGSGGGSAIRKEVWQQLGGFDEDYWMYLEDVDFAFRAQLAGYEAVYVPQAQLYHHLSATGGDTLASYYVGRNTIWTVAKNMPRGLLLRNLPAIVTAQVEIARDALQNFRGAAARERLRGQLAGLMSLPQMLRKRQIIQPRRVLDDGELKSKLTE